MRLKAKFQKFFTINQPNIIIIYISNIISQLPDIVSANTHKYNTNFKNAFNKARQELGSNAIFKFHGKLYTTNHPGENKDSYSVLINKEMDFDSRM